MMMDSSTTSFSISVFVSVFISLQGRFVKRFSDVLHQRGTALK